MDAKAVGQQIAYYRKTKQMTQSELGERLNISYQAVSKWERGESLPDTAILVDLANILETTVDSILCGGERIMSYKGRINVSDMREGISCLKRMGQLLGKDNILYRNAISGINEKMNTDIEEAFTNDFIFEAFVGEAIIHGMNAGAYIDLTDIKANFKHQHFSDLVCEYAMKHGIK